MITIAQIYAAMSDDTCAYGLRVCRWLVWSGETLAPSSVWIDGNYTDELLPGTCCIALGDIDHRPSLAENATNAFWALDKLSAFQVWFAAASDDCRAFSQDMNEHITECFYQK